MSGIVERTNRFRMLMVAVAFAAALLCALFGMCAWSPTPAIADEASSSGDVFADEALSPDDLFTEETYSSGGLLSKDVYLEPGERYDVGKPWLSTKTVHIRKPGEYTLHGSSSLTTVHITSGNVTVYLENKLEITPNAFANLFGSCSAISVDVKDSDAPVRLVTKENATVKLGRYGEAPSVDKRQKYSWLYFETENPDKPGHLICRKELSSGNSAGIGTSAQINTVMNICFKSGKVTAQGSGTSAGIGTSDANGYASVSDIVFEGTAEVVASCSWSGPGIGSVHGNTTSITIKDNAKVTAYGKTNSPGIGSGSEKDTCAGKKVSVTIVGGQVNATAYTNAPGIGTPAGTVDAIKITGGTVTAKGDGDNPAIGTGSKSSKKSRIEISGGYVTTPNTPKSVPSIGTRSNGCTVDIAISGGTVDVKPGIIGVPKKDNNDYGDSKVTITGGSVRTELSSTAPSAMNTNGKRVFPVMVALEKKASGSVLSFTAKNLINYSYGDKDLRMMDGCLYAWLPDGSAAVSASDDQGNFYIGTIPVNNSSTQGTLYLGDNVILDGGDKGMTDGSARISVGGTSLSNVKTPTAEGYVAASYRSSDRLIPVADAATYRLLPGDGHYVDENGQWIYTGVYPIVLRTLWKPISYGIEFDPNVPDTASTTLSGTMIGKSGIVFGDEYTLRPNQYKLPGYEFTGWNTEPDGSGLALDDGGTITGDGIVVGTDSGPYTLYAQWGPVEYEVTFESGTEVTNEPYTQTLTFDQEEELTPVRFKASDYYFAGWASSDGNAYADRATVENLCTVADDGTVEGCTLTAKWATDDDVSVIITNNDDPVEILNPETAIELVPKNAITDIETGPAITDFKKVADGIYVRDNVPGGTYGIDFDPKEAEYNTGTITVTHKEGTHTSVSLTYYEAKINVVEDGHVESFINYSTPSGISEVTVLKGTEVTLWAGADKGYVFDGYTCIGVEPEGLDASSEEEQTITINGKVEITPHARPVNYTVKFDANAPSTASSAVHGEMGSLSMVYGESTELPKNAFRLNGHTFTGWNTKADGTGTTYSDGGEIENLTEENDGGVTLYAQWTANKYDVSFDSNVPDNASTSVGGSMTTMDDLKFDGDERQLAPNGFTLPGYEFAGWNTSPDGTGTYFADQESVRNLTAENEATVVLYAQWLPRAYTITFDDGDGSGSMNDFEAIFDETVQLPACAFSYEGHTFSHWSSAAFGSHYGDCASVKNLCGTPNGEGELSPVTLTANWVEDGKTTVVVRVNGNAASDLDQSAVKLKAFDGNIEYSAASADEGRFTFTGLPEGDPENDCYVVEIDGYDTGQTVVERGKTVTLDYYSVSINGDSHVSSAQIGGESVTNLPHVLAGTIVTIDATAETGYVFDGYTADGVDPTWDPRIAQQNIVINGQVKITAHARGAAYTVHFDPNIPDQASTASQFTGTMGDCAAVYGSQFNLPHNGFSLPGYTFAGWNTAANGKGTAYSDGASVSNLTAEDGGKVTLYAQWNPCTYEIQFNAGDATGMTASQTAKRAATFDEEFALPSPSDLNFTTPEGKSFLGWTTGAFGNCYLAKEKVVNLCNLNEYGQAPTGLTLTAMWTDSSTTTVVVTDDDVPSARFDARDIALHQGATVFEGASGSDGIFTFGTGTTSSSLPDGKFDVYVNGVDTGITVERGAVAKVPYCTVEIIGDLHANAHLFDPLDNEPISDPAFVLIGSRVGINAEVDEGYNFESYTAIGTQPEWENPGQTQAKQTITVNGKVLIEAHAVNSVYTVHFDANGGTGAMDSQDMVYGEPQNLFANAFSRAGYMFAGWNTVADGTGTAYSDGASVSNLTAEDGGKVTLYAQWAPIQPPSPSTNEVGLEMTGHGIAMVNPQNAKAGETVTVITQPDEGYGVFSIEVVDSAGNQVVLSDNEDGTYSFEMPEGAVTVKTTFKVILPFPDLDWHHWGYDDIALAYERGLMVGYDSGLFGPDDVTTRAMAVTVIWRFAGCPQSTAEIPFSDVGDGQWYSEAIRWAAESGIAAGYEGTGLFGPEDDLTREQLVALLMRYAETEDMDTSTRADLSTFVDGGTVSPWADAAVKWAVAEGLLRGNSDTGTLDPQDGGTRAALTALVMRYDAMLPVGPVV